LEDYISAQIKEKNLSLRTCGLDQVTAFRAASFALESIFVQMRLWVEDGLLLERQDAAKAKGRQDADDRLAEYEKEEAEFYETLKR